MLISAVLRIRLHLAYTLLAQNQAALHEPMQVLKG